MIKIAAVFSAIALMFTSGMEALTIESPSDRSTYGVGQEIDVLVVNNFDENFVSASVTIASACGNLVTTVPVGTTQRLFLPCQIVGDTIVAARVGDVQASNVHILVSPVYNNNIPYAAGAMGCGYPYGADGLGCRSPCDLGAMGCGSPCGPIACPPRPACRRSRRGCGYYGIEEAHEVEEFNIQNFEQ